MKLEELTAPEVHDLLEQGWDRIIVPLGATEQHGPGLPLGVDTYHAEATAVLAAERLGQTLVAPTVPLGYSPEHTAFPGTITLRPETLVAWVEDTIDSLSRSGFGYVYVWFGHGGNWAVLRDRLTRYGAEPSGPRVGFPRDLAGYVAETWERDPPTRGVPVSVSGSHAGEFEASMLWALRPDLVRRDRLAEGDPRPLDQIAEQMMERGIDAVSANGVLGDQRAADPERGRRYLDVLADWLVRDFLAQEDGA